MEINKSLTILDIPLICAVIVGVLLLYIVAYDTGHQDDKKIKPDEFTYLLDERYNQGLNSRGKHVFPSGDSEEYSIGKLEFSQDSTKVWVYAEGIFKTDKIKRLIALHIFYNDSILNKEIYVFNK